MKTFEGYMVSTRFRIDGSKYKIEDACVQYKQDGTIIKVEITNDLIDDWTPIDFEKTTAGFKKLVAEFIENEILELELMSDRGRRLKTVIDPADQGEVG